MDYSLIQLRYEESLFTFIDIDFLSQSDLISNESILGILGVSIVMGIPGYPINRW